MAGFGDDENYLSGAGGIKTDYVTGGGAAEEDPFAALDDFSAEENSDNSSLDVEAAMGTEYKEEFSEDEAEASGKESKVSETKPQIKKLTAEDVEKITEKNRREKKLSYKSVNNKSKAIVKKRTKSKGKKKSKAKKK